MVCIFCVVLLLITALEEANGGRLVPGVIPAGQRLTPLTPHAETTSGRFGASRATRSAGVSVDAKVVQHSALTQWRTWREAEDAMMDIPQGGFKWAADGSTPASLMATLEFLEAKRSPPKRFDWRSIVGTWLLEYSSSLIRGLRGELTPHVMDTMLDMSVVRTVCGNGTVVTTANIVQAGGVTRCIRLYGHAMQIEREPRFTESDEAGDNANDMRMRVAYIDNGLLVLREEQRDDLSTSLSDLGLSALPVKTQIWRRIQKRFLGGWSWGRSNRWSVPEAPGLLGQDKRESLWRLGLSLGKDQLNAPTMDPIDFTEEVPLSNAHDQPLVSNKQALVSEPTPPQRVDDVPDVEEDSLYADALRYVREIYELAEADVPPTNMQDLKTMGWKDISTNNAKILHRYKEDTGMDILDMDIKSEDQAPGLQFMNVSEAGTINGGWLPGIWAVPFWKHWFPFCEDAEILRRFTPELCVVRLRLRIIFLVLDTVFLFGIFDRVDAEGGVHIVVRSPPSGYAGKEWLGVQVPPNVGTLARLNHLYKIRSTGENTFRLALTGYLDENLGAPFWLKQFAFRQYGKSIFSALLKFQDTGASTGVLEYLNGDDGVNEASRDFLLALRSRERSYVAGSGGQLELPVTERQ